MKQFLFVLFIWTNFYFYLPSVAIAAETNTSVPSMKELQFLQSCQKVRKQALEGWTRADASAIAAVNTEDAILLIPDEKPVIGRTAIVSTHAKSLKEGIRVLGVDTEFQNVRKSGKYVFSVDHSLATVRMENIQQLLMADIKGLTVWEIQPDGSLKVKIQAWNNNPTPMSMPDLIGRGIVMEPGSFHAADNRPVADASQETLEAIRKIDREFEKTFLDKDAVKAAGFYANEAMLLIDREALISGPNIKPFIAAGTKLYDIQKKDQQIISVEGTEEMVFVVNSFVSEVKPVGQEGDYFTFPYKGIHIWQKQADGSWKIIMDLNSGSGR